jgi:enoyl-CoA hydratase/carnithine racemase
VILIHGGKFYSSGNDLKPLMAAGALNKEEMKKISEENVKGKMGDCLLAMHKSKKPTIAVVRGGCVGIAFTTLCLADFVYVAPDAYF